MRKLINFERLQIGIIKFGIKSGFMNEHDEIFKESDYLQKLDSFLDKYNLPKNESECEKYKKTIFKNK